MELETPVQIKEQVKATVTEPISLSLLCWTFLKIGSVAFGGFMSLISVVQNVVVERRKLLSHEDMLDGISLATLLPGPVAVNVVAYVGYRLRGIAGALVSAIAVTLPAFLLILGLSVAYFRWGQLPIVAKAFSGFIPAVAAIIAVAAWNMAQKAIKGWIEVCLALAAGIVLLVVGGFYSTLSIISCAGVLGWLLLRDKSAPSASPSTGDGLPVAQITITAALLVLVLALIPFAGLVSELGGSSLVKLFLTFASMSMMLFGGGYVFVPLIQEVVVQGLGWVTQQEFIDAVAMGQVTPGPILISAAFIGYKVAGFWGALSATLGIFSPPAVLMVASSLALQYIKRSPSVKAILAGIRPAVVGMIFAAAVVIGKTAPLHWVSLLIFAASLYALLRLKIDVVWIIPAAGVLGLLL